MANNRTCFFCGKEYSYCPSCYKDREKPSWYSMFCCDSCRELDKIVSAHTNGKVTDEEAKNALEKINYSLEDIKNVPNREHIKTLVAVISHSEKKTTKNKKTENNE